MKQQNKYLALAIPSLIIAGASSFACYVTAESSVFGVAMFTWAAGCALSMICIHGFADSQQSAISSHTLDLWGQIFGLKRKYFGLEFDSAFKRRLYGQLKYDRQV